jgi:phosphomevalonate kinase
MRDDEETELLVKEFLGRWSQEHEIQVRLMEVKGETEGVRKERLEEFKAWIHG